MKFHAILFVLSFAFLTQASAKAICDTSSESAMRDCLIKQTGHIHEANLENDYVVVTTDQARKDLLLLASYFDQRTDRYGRKIQATRSVISKAKALAVVAQYEDEPSLHYFAITTEGNVIELFDFSVIDFKETFYLVSDRQTFSLHAQDISTSLQESINWSYEEIL